MSTIPPETCADCDQFICNPNFCKTEQRRQANARADTIGRSDAHTIKKFGRPLNFDEPRMPEQPSGMSSIETERRKGTAPAPFYGAPTLPYQGSHGSGGSYPPGSAYQSGYGQPTLSGSIDHATASLPESQAGDYRKGFHKGKDDENLRQTIQQAMDRDKQTQNLGQGLVGPASLATTGSNTPSGSKGQQGQSKKPDSRSGGQGGSKKGTGSGGSKK